MLAYAPAHTGALFLVGLIALEAGRPAEAIGFFERAVAADGRNPMAHAHLGLALAATEQHAAAAAAFRAALARDPDGGPVALALSASLLAIGDNDAALAAAERAAVLLPASAAPRANRATAFARLGRATDAALAYDEALERDPAHRESLLGLAALRRTAGADRVTVSRLFERAADASPDPETLLALAEYHRLSGDGDGADATMRRARGRFPDDPLIRLGTALLPLVPIHRDAEAQRDAVSAWDRALDTLDGWARAPVPGRLPGLADAFGRAQTFFLPYATDDVRALNARFGRLAVDAIGARHGGPPPVEPARRRDGARVRLGIVSGFVRDHSVWKVPLAGWLRGLDRDRFAITVYAVGETDPDTLARARDLADLVRPGPHSTAGWRALILADRPDALIHAEIGMSGSAFRLAALRLAPLQLAGPGHPVTTGLPTIDGFLSSALMEPPDGDRHYTERLHRLPGLGFAWRPRPGARTVAPPALPEGTRLFCGQSPFKYRPDDDVLLARIAEQVPDARFVLVAGAGEASLGAVLDARLGRAFAARGLDWRAHGHVLGRLTPDAFASVSASCDVVLDAPSWSGCNSTLEGLAAGATPVVTCPGPVMRARHTAAILTRIGVTDGIATDRDDYVRRAVALARDPDRRRAARAALVAAGVAVLDDPAPVRALERLLLDPDDVTLRG